MSSFNTIAREGSGARLVCAGALAFQEKRGVSSNYQRVCERIFQSHNPRKAAPPPKQKGEK